MQQLEALQRRLKVSDEVVAREIDGEVIIIPLSNEIGDLEDELYTLNKSAYAFWKKVDGHKNLGDIINELAEQYEAESETLHNDVLGLVDELLKRKILVEI